MEYQRTQFLPLLKTKTNESKASEQCPYVPSDLHMPTSIRMSPVTGTWRGIKVQLGCENPNHSKNIFSKWMQGFHHVWELGHSLDPEETEVKFVQSPRPPHWVMEFRLTCGRHVCHWRCGCPDPSECETDQELSFQTSVCIIHTTLSFLEMGELRLSHSALTLRIYLNIPMLLYLVSWLNFSWTCSCFPKSDHPERLPYLQF